MVLWLLALTASAQIPGTDNYDRNFKWSVEEQLADFEVFRYTLEEVHPGLYRYRDKSEIDAAFATLKGELSAPLTDRQLNGAFARFFTEVQCGHTYHLARLRYYRWLENNGYYFPFPVKRDGNRLYVTNELDKATFIRNAEIISMNSVPTADILAKIDKHIAADGRGETYRQRMTEKNFEKYYHAFVDTSRTTYLELRPVNGVEATVILHHLTLDQLEAHVRSMTRSLSSLIPLSTCTTIVRPICKFAPSATPTCMLPNVSTGSFSRNPSRLSAVRAPRTSSSTYEVTKEEV